MPDPLVLSESTPVGGVCRCGNLIPPNSMAFRVVSVAPNLQPMFRGQLFCSAKCIRVLCLESLESLDAVDTVGAKATVTDLHQFYLELAQTYARLVT